MKTAKKMYQATDCEVYRLLTELIDEGYDVESAADRIRNEVDEAVTAYENRNEE